MPRKLSVDIRPATDPEQGVLGVSVEIIYEASVSKDGDPLQTSARTIRSSLSEVLQATAILNDFTGTTLTANVLGPDGSAFSSRIVEVDDQDQIDFDITTADIALIMHGGQQLPTDRAVPTITRSIRLVSTGGPQVDYVRSSVAVSVINDDAHLNTLGLDTMLDTSGGTITSAKELASGVALIVNRLTWEPAHLAVDGTFEASFPLAASKGWLWWLIGDSPMLGYVADDLSKSRGPVIIAMPLITASTGGSATNSQSAGGGCDLSVPKDVTETELANNPSVFSEDPGSFCRPFQSPERITSERSFAVIARVTQPAVSAVSSRHIRGLNVLQLEAETLPNRRLAVGPIALLRRALNGSSAALPGLVLPKDLLPHRQKLLDRYDDLLHLLPGGRRDMDENNPLQWEDDVAQYQATQVALGHILEFRVRTRSNGYSLGTVAKTLTLAPRQARRIQKVEWRRSERSRRTERTSLADQVNDSTVRERDFYDSVSAHLDEWATGSSSSDTEAVAGGIGFAAPGVVGGVGGGAASAHSTSHQEGGRDTTASETQRLRDAIRRHGDSLRKFESTVVNEVTQEEEVTGTTEVIRNYNYAHSLTVIYYQILRHLKVSTEFAGARQCVFVPFAIRPFDVQRAYRWKESIALAIRTPRFGRALRYLKDVASNFSTSDIAPGPRASQPLTFVRGSLYVTLAVERPADSADDSFDSELWQVAQPLLSTPALGIFSILSERSASQRDAVFQAQFAPDMAARWADGIRFLIPGGRLLRADCTLATRYRFNRSVRIDFSIEQSEVAGLSRSTLSQLQVVPSFGLPPGSVGNLTRLSLTYSTPRFEHQVEARTGTDDLIKPITGNADTAPAFLPLDRWEQVDEQLELTRAVQELVEHLNEHVEYYHKAIWWRMDRDRLLMMLDGFYVPTTNNVSIASIVDREPLAIIGNSLVYRIGAASFVPMGKVTSPRELYEVYAEKEPVADPLHISLPTDGLYAQTIMDECNALEDHYGSSDWALTDTPPDISTIDPQLLATRADAPPEALPTALPNTIINLQNAPDAPAPQGLAGVLNSVTNPNSFRDMAGLAGTQANARAALETAAALATTFGSQAAALELAKLAKAEQGTRDADKKLATIQRAADKGLVNPEVTAAVTKDVLAAMTPGASADGAIGGQAVERAINAATQRPGSTIETTTADGVVKVAYGPPLASSTPLQLRQVCGFFGPADVVVTETDLRARIATTTVAEHDEWWNAAAVVKEDANTQFGELVAYWLSSSGGIRPTTLLAMGQTARSLTDADFGALLAPLNGPNAPTTAQLTNAVRQAQQRLLQGAPDTSGPANLNDLVEQALYGARRSRLDLTGGAWSAVFVSSCVRMTAINLGIEGYDGVHVGRNGLLRFSSAHRVYILEAYQSRFGPNARRGTYHAFEPAERAPQRGDVIVQDRRDTLTSANQVVAFSAIPTTLPGGIETHGDIIVDVPAGQDYVVAIGGNLGGSSRIRHYPLNANGRLVVAKTSQYVAEDDAGSVPNLPSTTNSALSGTSTARIFALLSPVEECGVVPGQEYHGGLIT